jgi:tight adherence protein B
MRRRLLAAGALLVALLTAAPAAHAAEASVDVLSVEAKGSEVTVVVAPGGSLAGKDLTKATWKVTQDGKPVKVNVAPVSNANLEVVLALDTSGSMSGAPMDAAKAAAEAFVAGLPKAARVAVVSFSSSPNVVVPLTDDRTAVVNAIRGLRAQGETALFDGVRTASSLFSAGDVRRQLVVLSDGGDTVSGSNEADAIDAIKKAKATGYVASLVTPDSATQVLENLAKASGGRVVSATDVSAIQAVFGSIGNVLTNQYRLTFPPVATGQATLSVSVTSGGSAASVDRLIDVPEVSTPTTLPAARVMPEANQGWMKLVGFGAAGAGMLALALFAFVKPKERRQISRRWLPEHATTKGHDTSIQDLTNRASAMAERSLQRRGWATRLDIALERGGVPFRPGEFILLVIAAIFGAFIVGVAFFGPLIAVAFAVAAAFLSRTVLRFKVSRRRAKFESQLGDTLQLLSGSLRAGYGLVQALDAVAKNSESPSADEFNRLIMEMRVGRDLPDALSAVATRIGSQDFDWVVEAITINREIGGDLTELLDRAAKTIRERDNVRRQIKSLSAEGKLSAYVLVAIPILLLLYMRVANPDYAGVLTSTPMGLVMLSVAGAGIGLGGLWLKKIIKVDF